jgi:drug/metabolite transporter (DMT)-like permease
MAGVLMCMAGVVLIVARGDPAVLAGLRFTIGDLWILLGAAAWSVYSVLLRHLPSRLPLLLRFAGMTLAGMLALAPFYALETASGRTMRFDAHDVGTVLFLAFVTGLGAFLAHAQLTALLGTRRTGLLLYIIPIYNAVLAMLVLGEQLHLYHLAGTLLILPGVYLATRAR